MNRNFITRFILLTTFIVLVIACAKISAPSGGPRDKTPPVVVKSVPANGAVNYRDKKIAITFDEYVVLDNIADKFMVSPPMKKKPRVFTRGKNVNVEFDDDLRDSTTYTFYFQDAVKDLNEGNILQNFQFVFSTGPVVDSLSVTGNVYKTLSLEAPEKTQVLMYKEMADSAVVKHLPDYIARVNPDGYFRIDNVSAGKYKLYALKDDDNSRNYNSVEEAFAFLDNPVIITPEKNFIPIPKDTTTIKKSSEKVPAPVVAKKATDKGATTAKDKKDAIKIPEPVVLNGEYKLYLFTAQKKAHYLTGSSRDLKYHLMYTLSLPPDSMKVEFSIPGSNDKGYFIEESRYRDTLKVWLTDTTLYSKSQLSTIVRYPFTDTLKRLVYKQDTIPMGFAMPRPTKNAKVKKPVFKVETNIAAGTIKPGEKIVLRSLTPFREPDTSRLHLYEIIDKSRKIIPYKLTKDSTNSCKYILGATFVPEKKYLYIADSASFSNIYNEYSDSTGIKFSLRTPESVCQITFDISNYDGGRIVQLLSNSDKIISEAYIKNNGKLVFKQLDGGTYRARVIYDLNGDGKWTTGDFDSGRQPEPVSYYKEEIEVKAGNEYDQDWDMGILNFKEQKLREKNKTK